MACTALVVAPGLFINSAPIAWSTAPSTTMGGKTVTRTATGISVSGPTGSLPFHTTVGGYTSKYMFFGSDNYLLILDSSTGPGPVTHRVSLVNFTTTPPSEQSIIPGVLTSGTTVNPPHVQYSQGTGSAFLIYAPNGTEITNLAIYRSDTGAQLCAGPPPFVPTGEVLGEATTTDLLIHYSTAGVSHAAPCPLPRGRLQVQPTSQTFPDVVLGGCVPSNSTRQFTLRNVGDDCLRIDAIGAVAPFSVTAKSQELPASLGPAQVMTVTVGFSPTAIGSFGTVDLPVTRTPAQGDDKLTCQGKARAPIPNTGFSSSALYFGSTPVGQTSNRTLTITNTGEVPVGISVPDAAPGNPFQWSDYKGTLPCGGSYTISIVFSPPAEGPFSSNVAITSNPPGSVRSVTLSGDGCVANAAIVVPAGPFPGFGKIQRGFRSVRYITVKNIGDGRLTFDARIAGADAALYGLQPPSGSVIDVAPGRTYAVDPQNSCGALPVGTGATSVAVAFFANDAPRVTNAELIIENHNATNGVPASWTFPLTAEIIEGVAVDAALVLDRSGSMAQVVGARSKSDAVIAGGRLFVQLMRPDVGDRLTIVMFNETPIVVQTMIEITSSGSSNQAAIVDELNAAALTPQGTTAIAGGVLVAIAQLNTPRATPPPALTRAMVVLTDGMDNTFYVNPDDGKRYTILGNVAWDPAGGPAQPTERVVVPSGINAYGIGLGKEADIDKNALNQLSLATGGYYGVVGDLGGPTYFDLEKYFTCIYMDVTNTPMVMDPVFTIQPGQRQRIEFDVLRGDVNALVVIYDHVGRLPFFLLSPLGEIIDVTAAPPGFQLRTGATTTARFIEFRMPAAEPDRYAGRWAVVVEHPGQIYRGVPPQGEGAVPGFVTREYRPSRQSVDYGIAIGVGSNFRMQPFISPGPVHVGEPILLSATISEAGLPVTGCTVTVKVVSPGNAVWNLTLIDDGAHDDGEPNDGEYARQFRQTAEEGSYEFTFRAVGTNRDGEPVVREATRAKYVEGYVQPQPSDTVGGVDECCKAVLEAIGRQTALLEQLLHERDIHPR